MSGLGGYAWLTGTYEYRRAVLITPGLVDYWIGLAAPSEPSQVPGGKTMTVVGPGVTVGGEAIVDDDKPTWVFSDLLSYTQAEYAATGSMSLEVWVKPNVDPLPVGAAYGYIAAQSVGPGFYFIPAEPGYVKYAVRTVTAASALQDAVSFASFPAGESAHLVGVHTPDGLVTLYVNGELAAYTQGAGPFLTGAGFLYLGLRSDVNAMQGKMGHTSYYNRPLSAAEARWHARVGRGDEAVPSYSTVENLTALPGNEGTSGSVTMPDGKSVQLAPLIASGVVSADPVLKHTLRDTGIFV